MPSVGHPAAQARSLVNRTVGQSTQIQIDIENRVQTLDNLSYNVFVRTATEMPNLLTF
jgi:hypothetical protein